MPKLVLKSDAMGGGSINLQQCLDDIQTSGSFALFEQLQNPPNPGLTLVNGGPIGLPLSDRDAAAIVAASHAAPFGKGHQTIVDTTVRKTWEMSPKDFKITNPAWRSFLQGIVTKVSAGLGVDSAGKGVSAELYKLLLYDEGAMFKPHQDSEKAPRMFGTLVIALPSKHEGGEVRVSHARKTHVFETSKFSDFHSSFLAWFSDVTHEVRPVTSGRRLVLTYNLVHTSLGSQHLSANSNKHMARLDSIFSSWNKQLLNDNSGTPEFQAYLFEHLYTDASLCYNHLKGHDLQVTSHLREVCNDHGFLFFLGNLETRISGQCEEYDDYYSWHGGAYYGGEDSDDDEIHPLIDVYERTAELTRVVELDGTLVVQNLFFDVGNLTRQFEHEDPDEEEDYSGFTGNEGVSATHLYRRTVAIIIPKRNRVSFFFTVPNRPSFAFEQSVKNEMARLHSIVLLHPEDQTAQADSIKLLQLVMGKSKPTYGLTRFSDNFVTFIIKSCRDTYNKTMFLESMDRYSNVGFSLIPKMVGAALLRLDLESSLPRFASQLLKLTSLSVRIRAIEDLLLGLDEEAQRLRCSITVYQKWLIEQVHEAMNSPELPLRTAEDAKLAGAILLRFDLQPSLPKFASRLSKIPGLNDRISIIKNLLIGLDQEAQKSSRSGAVYQKWLTEQLLETATSPGAAIETAKDGAQLAKMSKYLTSQEVFNKILPTVKKNVAHTAMALKFLTELLKITAAGGIPGKVSTTVFHDVLSDLAPLFTLGSLVQHSQKLLKMSVSHFAETSQFARTHPSPRPLANDHSTDIATLLCNCQSLELRPQLELIVTNLTSEMERTHITLITGVYFPILNDLIVQFRAKDVTVMSYPVRALFQAILKSYIERYVQAEPKKPGEINLPMIGCPCPDCSSINQFFACSRNKEIKLGMNQIRRTHVGQQLNRIYVRYTTEKTGSPHSLVVTKTTAQLSAGRYAFDLQAWTERVGLAKLAISGLPKTDLKDFLGDMYEPITSVIPIANAAPTPSPVQAPLQHPSASASAAASVASARESTRVLPPITKRKVPKEVVVIDLLSSP